MIRLTAEEQCYDFKCVKIVNVDNDTCILRLLSDNQVVLSSVYYEILRLDIYDKFQFYLCDCLIKVNELHIDVEINQEKSDFKPEYLEWIQLWHNKGSNTRIWHHITQNMRQDWLEFCFDCQRIDKYHSKEMVVIDGCYIKNEIDFLCEISYQTFGDFGYMGSSLWGLYDILTGGLSDICHFKTNIQFRWVNFSYSQQYLDAEILDEIIDYFYQSGYELSIYE